MGKNNKKYTYEEVKKIIEDKGYALVSDKYLNNRTKLIFKDKEGYLYFSVLTRLQQGMTPEKFHICNPYTIHNIKLWCELNNKPFILISDDYKGNNIKMDWKCLKENCGEIFRIGWNDILSGKGCGVCVGQQVVLSNCLATKNPKLTKEWHPTKNGDLTPYDVGVGYEKTDIWWQCRNNPKHVWKATISSRHIQNNGCPYCSGRSATIERNLLIDNYDLCKEWDYKKNKNKPEEYLPNSGKKVWWICQKCGYNWKASIGERNKRERGCPECNKSKGEKRIENWLKEHDIYNEPQKTFNNLIGTGGGLLSYDFYLPKPYNILIEMQGQFHDGKANEFVKINLKKQKEHDRRKREYAQKNNIKLLEIWYWDYDNIEEILKKELLNLINISV